VPAGWTAVTRGWRGRASSFLGGIVGKASRRHHERRPGPPRGRRQRPWKQGRQGVATAATEARKARRPADRQGEHRDPGNTVSTGRREARVPQGTLRRSDPPPPLRTAPTGAPSPPPRRGRRRAKPRRETARGCGCFGAMVWNREIEARANSSLPCQGEGQPAQPAGWGPSIRNATPARSRPRFTGPTLTASRSVPPPGRGGTAPHRPPPLPTAHRPFPTAHSQRPPTCQTFIRYGRMPIK
jgi:hypothetical protein